MRIFKIFGGFFVLYLRLGRRLSHRYLQADNTIHFNNDQDNLQVLLPKNKNDLLRRIHPYRVSIVPQLATGNFFMKRIHVGGPLLGCKRVSESTTELTDNVNNVNVPESLEAWQTFAPLVSDPVPVNTKDRKDEERLLLLTTSRYVAVRSYRTGKRIATFVPKGTSSKTGHANKEPTRTIIHSVCLTNYYLSSKDKTTTNSHSEQVLLAGMNDGSIQEFPLASVFDHDSGHGSNDAGVYRLSGQCVGPRRILGLTDEPVLHLAATTMAEKKEPPSTFVYAICETSRKATNKAGGSIKVQASLVRFVLPPVDSSTSKSSRKGSSIQRLSSVHILSAKLKYSLRRTKRRDKHKVLTKGPPFAMVCTGRSQGKGAQGLDSPSCIFVLVGSPASLSIYQDLVFDTETPDSSCTCITMSAPSNNPLSAFALANNGKDVSLGHWLGDVRVMENLLPLVDEYIVARARFEAQRSAAEDMVVGTLQRPPHPSETVVGRKLHWHAHPVSSLVYDTRVGTNNAILYSGGDESVLVTWQLSQGTYKPAEVLPRLALGGIVHISSVPPRKTSTISSPGGVIVYCEDNSLQLFESHNKSLIWKVTGLAAQEKRRDEIFPSCTSVTIDPCNTSSTELTFSGLPRAPGYLQWYDLSSQSVVSSLEVVPFNRVSRTERNDSPMPAPSITHALWNRQSGQTLLTIDKVPTENTAMGYHQELPNGDAVGVISTIRFWSRTSSNNTFELTAAMSCPHGMESRITSAALSEDGNYACTVSNDENAFRLWRRVEEPHDGDQKEAYRRKTAWICDYKISTPAGFSKFPAGRDAAAFSADSSIVAIAYGHVVTLWDRQEMVLVSSLRPFEDGGDYSVELLRFVSTQSLPDMLLVVSPKGVALASPFGSAGPANRGWLYVIDDEESDSKVCAVEYLPSPDLFAIAVYTAAKCESEIHLVDAVSGKFYKEASSSGPITGKVVSIAPSSTKSGLSSWPTDSNDSPRPVSLYALTADGDLIAIHSDDHDEPSHLVPVSDDEREVESSLVNQLPATALVSARQNDAKRDRVIVQADELAVPPTKKLATANFALSSAFVRSFLGKNLSR